MFRLAAIENSATLPALALPPIRRWCVVGALVLVAAFGWVMPWLTAAGS